jgi:hypothetical protein
MHTVAAPQFAPARQPRRSAERAAPLCARQAKWLRCTWWRHRTFSLNVSGLVVPLLFVLFGRSPRRRRGRDAALPSLRRAYIKVCHYETEMA